MDADNFWFYLRSEVLSGGFRRSDFSPSAYPSPIGDAADHACFPERVEGVRVYICGCNFGGRNVYDSLELLHLRCHIQKAKRDDLSDLPRSVGKVDCYETFKARMSLLLRERSLMIFS